MKEILLVKNGEIALKGLNKSSFEQLLIKNITKSLSRFGSWDISKRQSTIYIEPTDESCDINRAMEALGRIFGIAGYSRTAVVEKDIEKICECAVEYLSDELSRAKSFKVESRRADKTFGLNSPQISARVGDAIFEHFNKGCDDNHLCLPVDVNNPDVTVEVEIRDYAAYVHTRQKKGAGGMPVGSGGRGMLLLSGGIDSPVAGYMMAKRGVAVHAVHFESFPYTSERALQKVLDLADIMSDYTGQIYVNIVSLTKIQEAIAACCDEEYFTLLLRRSMMRIAQKVADYYNCGALITGESLGQVASQTMEALCVTNAVATVPVYRPCIGLDKEEIVQISRKIGTYDKSIEPFEDCCTVFTPRHPKTKPDIAKVMAEEEKYDYKTLEEEAFNARRFDKNRI